MMRYIFAVFFFNILIFPFSSAMADDGQSLQNAGQKAGSVTYERYCASCHGIMGIGDGPVARSLLIKPADLTQLSAKNGGKFPEQRVIKTIDGRLMPQAHGSSDMPIWGQWFAIQAMAEGVLQEDLAGIEDEVAQRLTGLVEYLKVIQR